MSYDTLIAALNILREDMTARINSRPLSFSGPAATTPASVAMVAQTQKIDQLTGVSLTNATVSGIAGLTDADIPDTITASNYLPLAGGTLTGVLTGTSLTLSGNLSAGTLSVAGVASGGAIEAPHRQTPTAPSSGSRQSARPRPMRRRRICTERRSRQTAAR